MWLVVGDGVVWVEYIDIYVDVNLFCQGCKEILWFLFVVGVVWNDVFVEFGVVVGVSGIYCYDYEEEVSSCVVGMEIINIGIGSVCVYCIEWCVCW